jgi:hypothetical protein
LPTYATLDEFMSLVLSITPDGEGYYKLSAYEAFILAILNRWRLEDEGTQDELDEVNADLAVLNDELGDAGRLAVMRQFGLWASNGDGWIDSGKVSNTIIACKV